MLHLASCNAVHAPSALKRRIDPRRSVNRATTSVLGTPATRAIMNTSYGESVMTLSRQHRPHALHRYENGLCRFILAWLFSRVTRSRVTRPPHNRATNGPRSRACLPPICWKSARHVAFQIHGPGRLVRAVGGLKRHRRCDDLLSLGR